MYYILITAILFVGLFLYFKIANKCNIIDKPNERSSHHEITIRGGGIIFPIVFLLFVGDLFFNSDSMMSSQNYIIFGLGLFTICTISFIDDIINLSNKIRLVFHFIAVTLLLYFINAFQLLPVWSIPILFVVIIGILNAYNFMDGINGITGLYSLVVLGSLLHINYNMIEFTDQDFIIYPIFACLVFLFFNFRKKAKFFMGDIGSMGIGFWILALLGLLILRTQEFKYLIFLTVYGIEVVFTIIERLKLNENIFKAHRRHLYQLLVNEKKYSHLVVSFIYAIVQLSINCVIIYTKISFISSLLFIVIPTGIIYLLVKNYLKKTSSIRIKN